MNNTDQPDQPAFLRLDFDAHEVPDGFQAWRIDADGAIWAKRVNDDLQAVQPVEDIDHGDVGDWPSDQPERPQFIVVKSFDDDDLPPGYQAWKTEANGRFWARQIPGDLGDEPHDEFPHIATTHDNQRKPGFVQRVLGLIRGVPRDV